MIVIEGHGYRVGVSAKFGGTILFAEGKVDGRVVSIFEPLTAPEVAKNGGCFVMAPFTNRIVGGRFDHLGTTNLFPMNRPEQDVAIHGFSRDRAWIVEHQSPDRLTLVDEVRIADVPWAYDVRQDISVGEEGLTIRLSVRNAGASVMPFGIGLHPWFPRRAGTELTLPAKGRFTLDARALPCLPFHPQTEEERTRKAEDWLGVDEAMVDATMAEIFWPDQGARVDIRAGGAFRHLHLFVPEARPVFCIEPVSHLPDVINRPELGADVAMTDLAPGEEMQGTVSIRLGTL